jgi:hypothetical protein
MLSKLTDACRVSKMLRQQENGCKALRAPSATAPVQRAVYLGVMMEAGVGISVDPETVRL